MTAITPPRSTSRLPLILVIVLALAALVGGGLFVLSRSQPKPAANLPPIVVNRVPERGEEQGTGSPIVVSFDKPMDRASVETAFAISPKIGGTFKWSDDSTAVQFVPTGSGFARLIMSRWPKLPRPRTARRLARCWPSRSKPSAFWM
jgi:hypothetical protein